MAAAFNVCEYTVWRIARQAGFRKVQRVIITEEPAHRIAAARTPDHSARETARQFGVSTRSVFRAIKRVREGK